MANKIQLKRGLKANLPVLSVGEPALTTDTKEVFIGNGTTNTQIATTDYVAAAISVKSNSSELSELLQGSRNINLVNGGQLTWGVTANTFTWSKTMSIFPAGGKLLQGGIAIKSINIAAGSATLTNANDCMYITIPTTDAATAAVTVGQYNTITGNDKLILAIRDTDSCLELLGGGWLVYGDTVTAGGTRNVYINKSLVTAANDFIVGTSNANVAKKTLAETKVILGISNITNESKSTMFTNPTFTGTITGVTPTGGDNSTKVATTAFVATASTSGNAGTATALQTARTISLTGGVTGSTNFDGSANSTITAVVTNNGHSHSSSTITDANNSTGGIPVSNGTVNTNLNADMLDGYHASQTAGDINTAVIRNSSGYIMNTWFNSNRVSENTAAAQYIYDTGDGYMRKKDIANVRNEIVTASDILTKIKTIDGSGSGVDADLLDGYHATITSSANTIAVSDANNNITATTFTGALSGNAATATKLATARTISLTGDVTGSASFDGSGNSSIAVTVTDNSHAHTSANISDANNATGGIPLSNGTVNTNLNADMLDGYHATAASTANTIAVSDANNNITAAKFTGALVGNASTATKLATARAINGVNFDGTANITITDSTKGTFIAGATLPDVSARNANNLYFKVIG